MNYPGAFLGIVMLSFIGLIYVEAFRRDPAPEVAKVEQTFDNIDRIMDNMDRRMDSIDAKLDQLIEKREKEKQQ